MHIKPPEITGKTFENQHLMMYLLFWRKSSLNDFYIGILYKINFASFSIGLYKIYNKIIPNKRMPNL